MWEKLKQVHYMFHIALVFIIFPVAGVISGEYPAFPLVSGQLFFVVAYYAVLLSNHRLIQFFSWCFFGCLHILWFCLVKYRIYLVYFFIYLIC